MDNNAVASGSAGSTSHKMLDSISDYLSSLTQTTHYTPEDYLDDGTFGLAGADLVANDGAAFTTLALGTDEGGSTLSAERPDFEGMSFEELVEYFGSHPPAAPSPSEASYVNPWDVVLDPSKALWSPSSRGTSSVGGTHASSKSTGSVSPADVHARDLEGEDPEVEIEPAFLLEAPSWSFDHDLATLVTEDDHHSLEEEENGGDVGKEGVEAPDTSSAEQTSITNIQTLLPARSALIADPGSSPLDIKGQNDRLEGEGAASAPTGHAPCPGLKGRNAAEIKSNLVKLLLIAEQEGAETRKLGLNLISTKGKTHSCDKCGKVDKRDRLLSHAVYKHRGHKTWACPQCQKAYATRDDLSHHLKAVKVLCMCGKSITRNNWYTHAKACEAYKTSVPLVGRPRLEKGMVVVDHQQPTPVQAGPSLPSSVVDEDTGADQARPPRVKSRPAARKAAKKRKALESEDESGGEIDKERKKKRVKRDRT